MIKGKIKIIDGDKVIEQPMNSFNCILLDYLSKSFRFGFNQGNNPMAGDSFYQSLSLDAGASDNHYGITVGSASTPLSCSSYGLSGHLSLSYPQQLNEWESACKLDSVIRSTRVIANNTGSAVTVREIGLSGRYAHTGGVSWSYSNVMFIRDIVDAVTIENGREIAVEYELKFTGGFTHNFGKIVATSMGLSIDTTGDYVTIDGSSEHEANSFKLGNNDYTMQISSTASNASCGLVIGKSASEYAANQYKLGEQIQRDEFSFYSTFKDDWEINDNSKVTRFSIYREFANISASTQTVEEIGVYVPGQSGYDGCMIARYLTGGIDVEPDETLKIVMKFKTVM